MARSSDRRFRSHDLTPADKQALAALAEYASMISHRITVAEAIDIGVGPSALDRLETLGWCRRDPSDSHRTFEISRHIVGLISGSKSPSSDRMASLERQLAVAGRSERHPVLWLVAATGVALVVWIGLNA